MALPPPIPPELAGYTPKQVILLAQRLKAARERVKRDGEAAATEKAKRAEAELAVAQTQILDQYRDDPVAFAVDILGIRPWKRCREILESVRDHRRTAVRSGHKVGKTMSLAVLALWWVKTRPRGRVIVTATKGEQIRDVFWREVQQLYRRAEQRGRPLGGRLYETAYMGLKYDDGREIIGKTSKSDGGAPGLGGYSGPEMLFIIDEASGVDDDVLEAFKGNMAGGGKLVAAGNPLVTSGFFYQAFTDKADLWNGIAVSSEESPNVTGAEERIPGLADKDYVDEYRKECGPEYAIDPVYQTRVLGQFPSQAPNAIIGLALVDQAASIWQYSPDSELLDVGVDVARDGDDDSAVCSKRGKRVYPIVAFRNQDSDSLAANVREIIFGRPGSTNGGLVRRNQDGRPAERPRVKVDVIGVGSGVYDRLKQYDDIEVFPINVSENPTAKPLNGRDGYDKLRDQIWFAARDFLRSGGTIPPNSTRLRSDLVAPTYTFNSQGQYKVEPKSDTKKRLKRSPDHGDAFCLCVYTPPPKPKVEVGHVNLHRR